MNAVSLSMLQHSGGLPLPSTLHLGPLPQCLPAVSVDDRPVSTPKTGLQCSSKEAGSLVPETGEQVWIVYVWKSVKWRSRSQLPNFTLNFTSLLSAANSGKEVRKEVRCARREQREHLVIAQQTDATDGRTCLSVAVAVAVVCGLSQRLSGGSLSRRPIDYIRRSEQR